MSFDKCISSTDRITATSRLKANAPATWSALGMLAGDDVDPIRICAIHDQKRKSIHAVSPRSVQMRRPTFRRLNDLLDRAIEFMHEPLGCRFAPLRVPEPGL